MDSSHSVYIGLTDTLSLSALSLIPQKIYQPEFIIKILPLSDTKVVLVEGNCFQVKGKIVLSPSSALSMETDLIIETKESTNPDQYYWEFYISKNNLFYKLGGRLRLKAENNRTKIGIFIDELEMKETISKYFSSNRMRGILRQKVRQFFTNIQKFIDERSIVNKEDKN